jgi:glycosyltransferase involved in cell wall biosynthesis/tetratricopeptide (TPR) repeat protein
MARFLFGPADDHKFTNRFLSRRTGEGSWITFSARAPSWESAVAPFNGSLPDALLLWPGYASVPAWVWTVPIPVIALANDPNLLWHGYRHLLPLADLILTDAPSARRLRQVGINHVRPANLFGLDCHFVAEIDTPAIDRDIDILFVGNLNPAVLPGRLRWVARLGRLADRYKVVITSGVFGAEYRALLRRTKLAFNHSIRGECNLRAFEAAAMGAVLLQEADNEEVPQYLEPGTEFAMYTSENFETEVARLLSDSHERSDIAKRAKDKVRSKSFDALIETAIGIDGPGWKEVLERMQRRSTDPPKLSLAGRVWQRCALNGPDADTTLARDLRSANDRYALALLASSPAEAEPHLSAAAASNRVASFGLASALSNLGRVSEAVEITRSVLADLESRPELTALERDSVPYPVRFDHLRVSWERASYDRPHDVDGESREKIALLKCRAYNLLSAKTGELAAYEGAAAACPDLPPARAALGCALARAGRTAEGIVHLQFAVENDPFDNAASAALVAAFTETGDIAGATAVRASRRLLALAAPKLVRNLEETNGSTPNSAVPAQTSLPPLGDSETRFIDISQGGLSKRFGSLDSPMAISGFTPPQDTQAVLLLLAATRPRRILEIGTAAGHMTANFTAHSVPDAVIYSIGLIAQHGIRSGTAEQAYEMPPRDQFAKFLDHFGTAKKAMLITADSRNYDFNRLAPLDFAFIDGGRDYDTVRSDSLGAYAALRAGGCLVWRDLPSSTPWVEVEKAVARLCFREPVYRIAGTQVAFLLKGEDLSATAGSDSSKVAVTWSGDFTAVHSLAVVNRGMCGELISRGNDVALVHASLASSHPETTRIELPPVLANRFGHALPDAVTVRHSWPPDFTPPVGSGAFVLIQPWEYGRLPRHWIEPILKNVDEIWAPSRSVLRTYVASGIPEDRIVVVPNGVDTELFHPDIEKLSLPTSKKVKLLFVGGTIPRKGFDVLLTAYRQAFSHRDDVCLVVKEMGAGTFYRGQTSTKDIEAHRSDPYAPELVYLTNDLPEAGLVRLYAACDVLIHPYRGEGFALPVLEAMACGKPVVVTAGGSTDEFAPISAGWRIPAKLSYFQDERIGDLPTQGKPWWLEPDLQALKAILKSVVGDATERAKRGRAARRAALGWTWVRAASIIEDRIRTLRARTPVRLRQAPTAPARTAISVVPDTSTNGQRVGPVTVISEPSVIVPAIVKRRPRVSLTMIVKNEEHNLPDCLTSVRDLVDEAIVVDTGSGDRTREIAKSFGAILGEFPWIDDFAAARNAALDHATGDYAFWMDADDRIDEANRVKLRALFDSLKGENDAYVVKCLCVGDQTATSGTIVDHVRVFRRVPAHRWSYRIHEQILPALRNTNAKVGWSGVTVRHVGYIDATVRKRKLQRDVRLLQLDVQDHPEDPFTLFNLGSVYSEMGDYKAAIAALEKSLARSHPKDSIVRKLYALLTQCHLRAGDRTKSAAACMAGRQVYPDDAELLFLGGGLAREGGDLQTAEQLYRRLVEGHEDPHFASVDSGLRELKGRNNLAVMLMEQNRLIEAEAIWRAALAVDPGFLMAHTGLGQLYLLTGNMAGVARQVAALRELKTEGLLEAAILDARRLAAQSEFAGAIAILKEYDKQFPRSVGIRVAMSHIRLADGSPSDVLEDSLRSVLEIDPGNSQARHNLEVLYRSTGRWIEGVNDWTPNAQRKDRQK